MIIGLSGYAGSGKSEAAKVLAENGWTRAKFAAPLKNMLRSLLRDQGVHPHDVERMIEGDLKEVPSDLLLGRTPRHAMQTLGTEWGRNCIGESLWVEAAMNGCLMPTVFDDCRFENEAAAIRFHGGIIIRINRPGVQPVSGHVSEKLVEPDWTIENNASIERLRNLVLDAAMGLAAR